MIFFFSTRRFRYSQDSQTIVLLGKIGKLLSRLFDKNYLCFFFLDPAFSLLIVVSSDYLVWQSWQSRDVEDRASIGSAGDRSGASALRKLFAGHGGYGGAAGHIAADFAIHFLPIKKSRAARGTAVIGT